MAHPLPVRSAKQADQMTAHRQHARGSVWGQLAELAGRWEEKELFQLIFGLRQLVPL